MEGKSGGGAEGSLAHRRRPCGTGNETAMAEEHGVGRRSGHGQGELTPSLCRKQDPTATLISAP